MTYRSAESCANARCKRCKCRCGGALHGLGVHPNRTEDIVDFLDGLMHTGKITDAGLRALERLREYVKVQEALL